MSFIVDRYRAGWKPNTDEGKISVKSTTGESKHLKLNNPAEFAAILAILGTSNSAMIDDNGIIWSGAEDMGE